MQINSVSLQSNYKNYGNFGGRQQAGKLAKELFSRQTSVPIIAESNEFVGIASIVNDLVQGAIGRGIKFSFSIPNLEKPVPSQILLLIDFLNSCKGAAIRHPVTTSKASRITISGKDIPNGDPLFDAIKNCLGSRTKEEARKIVNGLYEIA